MCRAKRILLIRTSLQIQEGRLSLIIRISYNVALLNKVLLAKLNNKGIYHHASFYFLLIFFCTNKGFHVSLILSSNNILLIWVLRVDTVPVS